MSALLDALLSPIAALFVATDGPYFNLPGVDPWDARRDARLYPGPDPVVAHPPCERWGRFARGGPNPRARPRLVGDDDGCFAAAVMAVRTWGGVLEHPEASHAWAAHGIARPPKRGGWVRGDSHGWTCCVEQGHYGHAAKKATWLYAVRTSLPVLSWGPSASTILVIEGHRSKAAATAERKRRRLAGERPPTRLSEQERIHTPDAFRDLLITMARSAR